MGTTIRRRHQRPTARYRGSLETSCTTNYRDRCWPPRRESPLLKVYRVGCIAASVGPDDSSRGPRDRPIRNLPSCSGPCFPASVCDLLHGGPCCGEHTVYSVGVPWGGGRSFFRRHAQFFSTSRWESVSRPAGKLARADLFSCPFFPTAFSALQPALEMSFNLSFRWICLEAETLRALMWASRLSLPSAAPTVLSNSVTSFFFFRHERPPVRISSYTHSPRLHTQKSVRCDGPTRKDRAIDSAEEWANTSSRSIRKRRLRGHCRCKSMWAAWMMMRALAPVSLCAQEKARTVPWQLRQRTKRHSQPRFPGTPARPRIRFLRRRFRSAFVVFRSPDGRKIAPHSWLYDKRGGWRGSLNVSENLKLAIWTARWKKAGVPFPRGGR